jgi:hypothetical protein
MGYQEPADGRGEETKTITITIRVEPSVKAASLAHLTPEIKDASPRTRNCK